MIRFERRLESPRWMSIAAPFIASVLALLVVAVILALTGHAPLTVYDRMIEAAFTRPGALTATLLTATPLVFAGLCAAVAFPLKAYNIGGEGQLLLGAFGASVAAIVFSDQPAAIAIPMMMVGGMVGGALWAAGPAVLRAHFHTSEILTSLMLNYVAFLGIYYLIFDSYSFLRDVSTPSAELFPQAKQIHATHWWPTFPIGSAVVPLGFVLAVVIAIALLVVMRSTRFGFRMRVISDSPKAGHYAGMRTRRTLVTVILLSGALAGLGGASQVGDFTHYIDPKGLQAAAFGYTGIVAAALGRFNPLGVVVAAIFLGGITNAGFSLQGETFPAGLVGVIQGVILFCVLSAEVLTRCRVVLRRPGRRAQEVKAEA
jgi:simple sugar transport system permease protein